MPNRKLTIEEQIRAIRMGVAAEEEAIHLYMTQADATDHPLAGCSIHWNRCGTGCHFQPGVAGGEG